jgi:hypothetical protein
MDQKQFTDVTYAIRGVRSLSVSWRSGCDTDWIRIAIDLAPNFGYVVSEVTVVLARALGRYDLGI